jgi:hypothetical protein
MRGYGMAKTAIVIISGIFISIIDLFKKISYLNKIDVLEKRLYSYIALQN